ncbi:hypothetical protein [Paenibacillus sp. MMS20-IR301]|uniref:hypothetical protein n=1 Tax=Paenibacillus sp. MMS20-IR301 TaxID=2895946 RepID=UPI0028E2AE0D|nr:hypothetical protein [Paenibacillus sp. MMS20-IR301]WNS42912.1 hypothetical protein LOS79_28745 [Paenibacillus sp. MMS20-IR301]
MGRYVVYNPESNSEVVVALPALAESERCLFKGILKDNFVVQEGIYTHHSREYALNSLSTEVAVTDYCLKEAQGNPILLLLAEASMDEFSLEKMRSFQEIHREAKVTVIGNGYHFLPVTNSVEVAAAVRGQLHSV